MPNVCKLPVIFTKPRQQIKRKLGVICTTDTCNLIVTVYTITFKVLCTIAVNMLT